MIHALIAAVAIVAHEPGYYTSLANHLQRWLTGQSVPARVVTPREMPAVLAREQLAFLVGFAAPTPAEMSSLRAFRARGGKLVVFHSAAPQLAELMGVASLGYAAARYPGQWSRMEFNAQAPKGCPAAILQTSSVLNRAAPLRGRGVVMAQWVDRAGRKTGDAAWIRTDAGWWMTHVLLADGDEALKAQLLGAICGAVNPNLWSAAQAQARNAAKGAELLQYAQRQWPRPGEIHAVWDHSGCGLYPGDWGRTIRLLQESRVTDLFVNVAGAGFAHYPSGVLPRSKTFAQEGDQLAACLAAAKGRGIRVHAWILCFTAARSSPDVLAAFRRKGWCLKTAKGRPTDYLDPSNAAVRGRVLAAVDEMVARYPTLSGVHLDFVRWYEGAAKPKNAAQVITAFVAETRRRVKRPKWLTTAVLGSYPSCVTSVGQDWMSWQDMNLVDYAVPMDYSNNMQKFAQLVSQHAQTKTRARKTIVGIGVTANESRLDARQVIDQVNVARKYGLAGESLFDLDVTLEKGVLPYLRLGLW